MGMLPCMSIFSVLATIKDKNYEFDVKRLSSQFIVYPTLIN